MLAMEYIQKLISSGQRAWDDLNKGDDELTEIDIQKALGCLDDVEQKVLAAKIMLREDMKELRNKNRQ